MDAEALLRSRVSHKTRMESVSEFVQQVAHDPDGCVACAFEALLAERDSLRNQCDQAMEVLANFEDEENDEETPPLAELAQRCFDWGDRAWYTAGKEGERTDAAEARVKALDRILNEQEALRVERDKGLAAIQSWRENYQANDDAKYTALDRAFRAEARAEAARKGLLAVVTSEWGDVPKETPFQFEQRLHAIAAAALAAARPDGGEQ